MAFTVNKKAVRSAQAATLLEFMYHSRIFFACRWFCVVHDPKPPLHSHNWLSFDKFQDTERFLIHCERHFSSRLPPSGGTWKYAKVPSTKKKKLGEILYPLICSFLPCLSWLLRSRVRKSRRDLWITLYFGWYPHPSSAAHSNCNYNIWHCSNSICYRPLWRGGVGTETCKDVCRNIMKLYIVASHWTFIDVDSRCTDPRIYKKKLNFRQHCCENPKYCNRSLTHLYESLNDIPVITHCIQGYYRRSLNISWNGSRKN